MGLKEVILGLKGSPTTSTHVSNGVTPAPSNTSTPARCAAALNFESLNNGLMDLPIAFTITFEPFCKPVDTNCLATTLLMVLKQLYTVLRKAFTNSALVALLTSFGRFLLAAPMPLSIAFFRINPATSFFFNPQRSGDIPIKPVHVSMATTTAL